MDDKNAPNPKAYGSDLNNFLNTQRASGMKEVGTNGGALAVATTNIDIFSNGQRVGFIQNASPSEQRTINKIAELGTEGVVQSVPSNTTGGSLSVSRIAIYNSSLFNALGLTQSGQFEKVTKNPGSNQLSNDSYKVYSNVFKTLKDQRVPLEIEIKTKIPVTTSGGTTYKIMTDSYVDCWLNSYSKAVSSQTITVTESATIMYSEVYTTISGQQGGAK